MQPLVSLEPVLVSLHPVMAKYANNLPVSPDLGHPPSMSSQQYLSVQSRALSYLEVIR